MSPGPAPPAYRFTPARSVLLSSIIVVSVLGTLEGILRLVGVRPVVSRRILLDVTGRGPTPKSQSRDIARPFMRADDVVLWSPQPGFHDQFLGKSLTINSLGLRGPEVVLPKPPGRRRILCLGDSITFGYGVGDEETYPFQLGRLLSGEGADVVNAGVPGYSTYQVLGVLRRWASRLQPDVVTVCVGWNDADPRPVDDREYARRIRTITALESPMDHVLLYATLKGFYLKARVLKGLVWGKDEPAPAGTRRVPLDQYRENLESLIHECRSRRITPVLLALPHRRKPGQALETSEYATVLEETSGRLRVPLVSMGELGLTTTLDTNQAYFLDSLHLTPEGNGVVARRLASEIGAVP